jgi:hypothetical protein
MQGPEDEGPSVRGTVRTDEQIPTRPFGGKAMLRLLELLDAGANDTGEAGRGDRRHR